MSINDLKLNTLELIKKQIEKENEIQHILRVLNDVKINSSLLSGRDFCVNVYNRRIKEYKEFCDKNTLKTSIFMKVIK